jgi:predicted AAA+ superfamily ATPase
MADIDDELFARLVQFSEKAITDAKALKHKRYLFDKLDKSSTAFYKGVYGLRGIGKTVLMLQLAGKRKDSIYIPADARYLFDYSLYDIVRHAKALGYKNIFIDEIQHRKDWTFDIKTLYDENSINLFFSGSSSMELRKGADLSRRALLYELKPASFREYLNIKKGADIPKIDLKDLLDPAKRKETALHYADFRELLNEYYKYGGVLYKDVQKEYPDSINNVLDKVVTGDLAYLREINVKIETDIYKLLNRIASSGPYEASYTKLASSLDVGKDTVIKILNDLEKVGLLRLVYPCGKEFRKEPKIFIRIPFRYAIAQSINKQVDRGAMREEFFVNSADVSCYYKTRKGEKTPDFNVAGKIIEVGGENKRKKEADYIAVDGASFSDNRIPLFLFGFLY